MKVLIFFAIFALLALASASGIAPIAGVAGVAHVGVPVAAHGAWGGAVVAGHGIGLAHGIHGIHG